MGHQLLISCSKFVFPFKWVSPLSLLIVSFEQWHVVQFLFFSFFFLQAPLFTLSMPLLDCKASLWEEAHPSCQSQSGTLVRRVRGFVSKVNEVAGTRNICQITQTFSSCWRLADTLQCPGIKPRQHLPLWPTPTDHRGTHMKRDRLFTLNSEHTRWEKFTPWRTGFQG